MGNGIATRLTALLLAFVFGIAMSSAALAQDMDASDDDVIDDDSVTDVQYTDNSRNNTQICAPVINQYNNIIQGGGQALAGGDAVSAVANEANVSNNIVINCINGDNNVIGGDTPQTPTVDDPEGPDDDTPAPDEDDGDSGAPSAEDEVMTATIPAKVLPTTGGEVGNSISPVVALTLGGLLLLVSGGTGMWLNVRYSGNSRND